MNRLNLFLLLQFAAFPIRAQEGSIFGKITDADTRAPLMGVNIIAEPPAQSDSATQGGIFKGTTTDTLGNYSISLDYGTWILDFKYIGHEDVKRTVQVASDSGIEISLTMRLMTQSLGLVTVSASKYEKKMGEESVSIEVLTPDFIENNNAVTLDKAIGKVPGVNLIGETVNIRGGAGYSANAGSRVLMLLDDIPWLTPQNSGIEFWALPIENIRQVEIIKGASSTFYGSSALNGTMNMITENPGEKPYSHFLAYYGAYENPFNGSRKKYYWSARPRMFSGAAFVHRRKFGNKLELSADAAFHRDESYLYKNEDNVVRGFIKAAYHPTETATIRLGANTAYKYGDSYFLWAGWDSTARGDSLAYVLNESDIATGKQFIANVDPYVNFFDKKKNEHVFKGRYFNIQTNNSQNENSTQAWSFYGEYDFHSRLTIQSVVFDFVTGISGSVSHIRSKIFDNRKSSNAAVFFQLDTRLFDRLTITGGVRTEMYVLDSLPLTMIDHTISGPVIFRMGANYAITKGTHLRGSFGLGYRYPSIAEKFVHTAQSGAYVVPNIGLQPESSWNAELGFNQSFRISKWFGYVDVAGFVSQYDNMMQFTRAPDEVRKQYYPNFPIAFWSDNVTDSRISGLEVSTIGKGKISGIKTNFLVGYTYMLPIDRNYNSYLQGPDSAFYKQRKNILNWRFQHSAKGDLECNYKGFLVGFTAYINSFIVNVNRLISAVPGLVEYRKHHQGPAYSVDARTGYSFTKNLQVTFIAKNITNKQNSISPGIYGSPSQLYGSAFL